MKSLHKKLLVTGAALIVVGGASYAWIHHHDKKPAAPVISATTKPSPTQAGVTINAAPASTTPTTKQAATNGNTPPSATVSAPTGTFVSDHHATLSDPGNAMNSTCRTTIGATCQINFTQGSIVKTLGPDAVGGDGSISWQWKLQDIGLTTGSWQVQAVATANGQTASTADVMNLEVTP